MNKTKKIIIHSLAILVAIIVFILLFDFYVKGTYGLWGGIFVDLLVAFFTVIFYYFIVGIILRVFDKEYREYTNRLEKEQKDDLTEWKGITLKVKIEPEFEKKARFLANWFLIAPVSLYFIWMFLAQTFHLSDNIFIGKILLFTLVLGPLFFVGYYLFQRIFCKRPIPLTLNLMEPETQATPVIQVIATILYIFVFFCIAVFLYGMIDNFILGK